MAKHSRAALLAALLALSVVSALGIVLAALINGWLLALVVGGLAPKLSYFDWVRISWAVMVTTGAAVRINSAKSKK